MMHLLNESHYWKALLPLSKVKANHYFALFVLEKQITGRVYADDPVNPCTFYIVHPYGMSLLFGSTSNQKFNAALRSYMLNEEGKRPRPEWLQAWPAAWNRKINQMLDGNLQKAGEPAKSERRVEEHTRANFRFSEQKFSEIREKLGKAPYPIVPVDRTVFSMMKGTVVPEYFWNSADDFCKNGVGFSMMIDGNPVCTAYSAYIFEGVLELGIETAKEFRGKGYAMHTCAALISYCLQNHYEPVWSCRLENTGSYILAQKIGFEPTITIPYYLLPV